MKLLLMIYSGPSPNHIAALLEAHDAGGYTELREARGVGGTGRLLGTRAWPGEASVFMSLVADDRAQALRAALRTWRDGAPEGEHLHVMTLPVDDAF